MYNELVKEFSEKKSSHASIAQLQEQKGALNAEVAKLRLLVRSKERVIMAFCHDLQQVVKYADPRDIERAVKEMCAGRARAAGWRGAVGGTRLKCAVLTDPIAPSPPAAHRLPARPPTQEPRLRPR